MSFQKRWLPILLAGIFVVAMVGASVLVGSPEVLFPEMTAILCGAWIQPKQAWNVNRPRMLVLMTTGAVFGLVMNLAFPGIPLPVRAVIGYAFCALCMNIAGADMTPMLSAAILPMLLGTDSWIYPAAVFVLVALVEVGQVALERVGLREPIEYQPFRLPAEQALASWARRLGVFALFAVPAYATGNLFLAVPPLLVAYTELTRPDFTLRLRPWRASPSRASLARWREMPWACSARPALSWPRLPLRRWCLPGTVCAPGCRQRAPWCFSPFLCPGQAPGSMPWRSHWVLRCGCAPRSSSSRAFVPRLPTRTRAPSPTLPRRAPRHSPCGTHAACKLLRKCYSSSDSFRAG